MISAIGGNNSLQMVNALNAFKADSSVNKDGNSFGNNFANIDTSNGIKLADNNDLLNKIDVNELRNCAQKVGEMDLTDDDIKYGLTYGRSVIADYLA
jgi:hypothetical protein